MNVFQFSVPSMEQWKPDEYQSFQDSSLVLVFGDRYNLLHADIYAQFRASFPKAEIVFSSTSGQILGTQHMDQGIAVTAVRFDNAHVVSKSVLVDQFENSFESGQALIKSLPQDGLKHVFVLSDGQDVNGTELVQGMNAALPAHVQVTGGLAGDDARFECTLVGLNNPPTKKMIAAIGFYGDGLHISCGSQGGWSPFGPERTVTKSDKNVLYELDGRSALDLYKSYLGELSKELPGSALRFPLSIKLPENSNQAGGSDRYLVRTILAVNESDQSMTFAGNLPEGSTARLMKSNAENLIDGALEAAKICKEIGPDFPKTQLSIMVSCVGRKLVLDQLVEEEVELASDELGRPANTGFYSYGEICPLAGNSSAELHNQTMTITTFSEL